MPETSRSFHYWQPAPRWRPLPWLANPGNPAMSPRAEGKKQAPVTLIKQWKEKEGQGRGDILHGVPMLRRNANASKADENTIQMPQCPMDQEHEESWRMRIYNKLLTVLVKLVFQVVNSIKLHLTASCGGLQIVHRGLPKQHHSSPKSRNLSLQSICQKSARN